MNIPSIGQLRHRVVIESLTNASDSQGGVTTTWATYATVWALLEPVKAWELNFAAQVQYRRSHVAWIRYRSDLTITESMRISFGGRYFQIKGIRQPDERKFFLTLDLEENRGT